MITSLKNKVFLFILFTLFISCLHAQNTVLYSTDGYISSSLVNTIYQDRKGFIWIATEYGLNRFDGNKFFVYKYQENDSTSLSNNYVNTIYEDRHNNIWVGTIKGLMKFHRDSDSFSSVPLYYNDVEVRPNVMQILERKNGELWIATSHYGIFQIDVNKNCAQYTPQTYNEGLTHIVSLIEDNNGNLWLGSETEGVAVYNPEQRALPQLDHKALSNFKISSLCKDDQGNIYIGSLHHGLYRYNLKTNLITNIPEEHHAPFSVKTLTYHEGEVLIGTDDNGLLSYTLGSGFVKRKLFNEKMADVNNSKIHSILYDRGGNLWLGLFQQGVLFCPKKSDAFHYLGGTDLNRRESLDEGCVMSIFRKNDNHLLVGIDGKGLYELDSQYNLVKHYDPKRNSNVPGIILTIFQSSDNEVWIGSFGSGVARFNKSTQRFEYVSGLENQNVFSIIEDRNRNLYFSTYGEGFYIYNLDTKKLKQYKSSESIDHQMNELSDNWVNSFFCDSEGMIWIGHFKGVSCFNPITGKFISYFTNNYPFEGNIGYSFAEAYGKIWIGTACGLYNFDKKTGKTEKYMVKDGICNDVICSFQLDRNNNLWMSTFGGLCRYNDKEKKFTNFYAADGLQGNEFTRGAAFYDKEMDCVYFGGTNGITYFNPTKIVNDKNVPDILLTDVRVSGNSINTRSLSSGKKMIFDAVVDARYIKLSHKDNTIGFTLSTMQFDSNKNTFYKYRIKEIDSQWNSTPIGANYIAYNNLAPGKYTFETYAVNRIGTSKVLCIRLLVTPPWYLSWWAVILYCFLILSFCTMLVNYIRAMLRRKKRRAERTRIRQVNEEKVQFFINMSHEIRTPMTLIINPLEKLMRECKDAELMKVYKMIHRNSQRILRLINQILDVRKIEKGQMKLLFTQVDVVDFINDIMLVFDYMSKQKNIAFSFSHDQKKLMAWLDVNNFDKILMNLLSNAFKYTPEKGKIEINLTQGENLNIEGPLRRFVEIRVCDTGKGIPDEKKGLIFDRFYQVNNQIFNSQGGTGVGLHLTRSLVQLHHGTIEVQDMPGGGSIFIVRIPQGKEHLTDEELAEENIPVNIHALNTIVNDQKEPEQKMKSKPKTRNVVLLVDDENEVLEYLETELQDEYKVVKCNNGKQAYEYLLSNEVNIVVSDVMMDVLDGITLCKKIRQNTNINHLPVILLTAKGSDQDKVEGLEIGADAYIVKPFKMDILRSVIANLIASRKVLKNKFSGSQQQKNRINEISIKSSDEVLMDKIMAVINKNISESDFTVEMLASEVGLSRVHLHRKLKELTNFSSRDFIKNIRMQQAAKLLEEKKLSVSEVAYAVGFNNLSHFSSSFKEFYGVPPTEYVAQNTSED